VTAVGFSGAKRSTSLTAAQACDRPLLYSVSPAATHKNLKLPGHPAGVESGVAVRPSPGPRVVGAGGVVRGTRNDGELGAERVEINPDRVPLLVNEQHPAMDPRAHHRGGIHAKAKIHAKVPAVPIREDVEGLDDGLGSVCDVRPRVAASCGWSPRSWVD
jgi:hypothetical protein